jgi:hypothetical protein
MRDQPPFDHLTAMAGVEVVEAVSSGRANPHVALAKLLSDLVEPERSVVGVPVAGEEHVELPLTRGDIREERL